MGYIKINKSNFYHNLDLLSKKAGSKSRIAGVIKDNAYGHGIREIANLLNSYGIKNSVVIDIEEATKIRDLFKNTLILNSTPVVAENLSFAVKSIEELQRVDRKARVELKVDTGMHRNGIALNELSKAIDIIKSRDLNIVGLFTHFKGADDLDTTLFWQKKRFDEVKRFIKSNLKDKKIRVHSFNSSALIRSREFNEDIARVGIAIYGYSELDPIYQNLDLKPVLSLWAKRTTTLKLKKGSKIGYGGKFRADRDMVVSTYDIGYGDGLFRGDPKKPLRVANSLPILGRVSMDFITLESTDDEICIFNDAKEIAKEFNTISYEILTALKPNLKRVVIDS